MTSSTIKAETSSLISHASVQTNINTVVLALKKKIEQEGDKPDSSVAEQLKIIDDLAAFELGRFLLINGGLNGFWTQCMVLWPKRKLSNPAAILSHPLEKWLLEEAPTVLATQERFTIFQKLLQESLKDKMVLASIPCGMMDDLLTLDFSECPDVSLVGIDLDKESLDGAKENARYLNRLKQTKFIQADAWDLKIENEFDIITSNGLNIYEENSDNIVLLYKNFYKALKSDGILISSFLTPPPTLSPNSPWEMKTLNSENLRLQKVIFSLLSVKWQAFQTESKTIEQLKEAGFKDIKIIYDRNKLFPTVVGRKVK
jgi:SAM-dependent methyltransferase